MASNVFDTASVPHDDTFLLVGGGGNDKVILEYKADAEEFETRAESLNADRNGHAAILTDIISCG